MFRYRIFLDKPEKPEDPSFHLREIIIDSEKDLNTANPETIFRFMDLLSKWQSDTKLSWGDDRGDLMTRSVHFHMYKEELE